MHCSPENNPKKDLKMMRQASYRNLPTVSDLKVYNCDEKSCPQEDIIPALEKSSLELDSFFEEECNLCKDRLESKPVRVVGKDVTLRTCRSSTFSKNTSYDALGDVDLSDDGLSYGSDDFDKDSDCSEDDEIMFVSDSNISVTIDDLLSDSSEEESFYIEEKENKKINRGLLMYKASSEPVMLINHYSLHTIDEEEGSESIDDCSEHFNDSNGQTRGQNRSSSHEIAPLPFIRCQSAPSKYESTSVDHETDNQFYDERIELSPDLMKFISKEPSTIITNNNNSPSLGKYSGVAVAYFNNNRQVDQANSEFENEYVQEAQCSKCIEGTRTTICKNFWNGCRYNSMKMRGRKIDIKAIIFTSSTLLIIFVIILIAHS